MDASKFNLVGAIDWPDVHLDLSCARIPVGPSYPTGYANDKVLLSTKARVMIAGHLSSTDGQLGIASVDANVLTLNFPVSEPFLQYGPTNAMLVVKVDVSHFGMVKVLGMELHKPDGSVQTWGAQTGGWLYSAVMV